MEPTQRSKPFSKKQLESAWKRYSSPAWIYEQSDAFIELECLKSIGCEVEMSISEISEKIGLSEQGVKDVLQSALNKLKQSLENNERK